MRFLAVALVCLLPLTARASEEEFGRTFRVTLEADTGEAFGEVRATLEAHRDEGRALKSITLTVRGKAHAVPKALFGDLHRPLLNSVEFRHEAGRGKGPHLYLVFCLAEAGVEPQFYPRVYIHFRDGKVQDRRIVPARR